MNIHVRNLTPTQVKAIERHKRFAADIQAKADQLAAHVEPEVIKALEPEAMPAEPDPPAPPAPRDLWFSMLGGPEQPSVRHIQQVVCRYYGVPLKDMLGYRRTSHVVVARHTAMYMAMELTDYSLPNLGRLFGNKDHTCLVNCRRKIKPRLLADDSYAFEYAILIEKITGGNEGGDDGLDD